MKQISYAIMIIAVIAGCAPTLKVKEVKTPNLSNLGTIQTTEEIDIMIEPFEATGLKKTQAIEKGEVSVFPGVFADVLLGENYLGRIRWNGWCSDDDGYELFSQILTSKTDEYGFNLALFIVDGLTDNMKNPRIIVLSTNADYAYDLAGSEFPLDIRFLKSHAYRKDFISKHGTPASELKRIPSKKLLDIIKGWSEYSVKKGNGYSLLTPLGIVKIKDENGQEKEFDQLKFLAGINPQYTVFQKWVSITKGSLSPDPISTPLNLSLETAQALRNKVPSNGVDFRSSTEYLTRRDLGKVISSSLKQQRELIKIYFDQNKRLMKMLEIKEAQDENF